LVQILLSEYAIERWSNVPPHLFHVCTLPQNALLSVSLLHSLATSPPTRPDSF